MNIKPILINNLSSLILGRRLWLDCRALVAGLESGTLSGSQKKDIVIKQLTIIFGDLGEAVMNCAIELSIAWIRSQQNA